ncbi:hypothetical protein GQ53DRAFT_844876 [Thozetella sp. PMI_491]|nr:hypothetical protein GQ53DRAFT_844876 [Thozetella sp. PMI_491]
MRTGDDWETVKPMIKELYMHQNVRLKDVIQIVQSAYKFRATPRMYKAQFAKWNWHKYKTATHEGREAGGDGNRAAAVGRKGTTASNLGLGFVPPVQAPTRPLEDDQTRELLTAMATHRAAIWNWTEQDPRWDPSKSFTHMGAYEYNLCGYFIAAMDHLHKGEFYDGGRLLRASFLEVEGLIMDGHIVGTWDMCVLVPQLALNYGRKDIADTFFRYVLALTDSKAPNHPAGRIIRSLMAFSEDNFDKLEYYTHSAWMVWTDTLVHMLGQDTVHTLLATRAYLCMRKETDPDIVKKLLEDYEKLVAQSNAALGTDSTEAASLAYDAMYAELRFSVPGEKFADRAKELLWRVTTRETNKGTPPATWSSGDRHVYRGGWFLTATYCVSIGDEQGLQEALGTFLSAPMDGSWLHMAVRLETVLRTNGRLAEAHQINAARRNYQISPNILRILEEEEREAAQNCQQR